MPQRSISLWRFWKTGKVLTMERMFEGATLDCQHVTFLDSSSVTNMDGMFNANSFSPSSNARVWSMDRQARAYALVNSTVA